MIVEGNGAQGHVVDANPAARRAGIQRGVRLSAAYALAPLLLAVAHDPRRLATTFDRLAAWAMQFTPLVSPYPPDALLMEIRGSLGLFGGHAGLTDQVREGLRSLGFTVRLAAAPTPLAALWRARWGRSDPVWNREALPGALSGLPLDCTGWPPQQLERMQGMGIRHLGDCLRLPRDGFARRFGRARLEALDKALGRHPDPIEPWQAPLEFATELELPAPMPSSDLLEIAFERLMGELDAFLLTRQAAVRRLDVVLVLETRQVQRIALRLAGAVSDSQYLMELLRERMNQVKLTAPVVEVALETAELQHQQVTSGDLFERTPRVDEDARRLLERLRTRLGENNVYGVARAADHRPEAAWLSVEPGAPGRASAPVPRPRPAWILACPARLGEDDGGCPVRPEGAVHLEEGPERIESGWWDGADVRRDYYVARGPGGERLWIYRDVRDATWYLHGIFA